MAAELQVMIDAQVTGIGNDLFVRNKKVDSETPDGVIKVMPIIESEKILSVLTQIGSSLMMGVYIKAILSTVYAGQVAATATVSLAGARLDQDEAMYVPINSLTVGDTYKFYLTASTSGQAEIACFLRAT
jgi:hypothetical protein